MKLIFNSVEEVHNHARDAVGKTMYELNGNKNVQNSKSIVGDAFEAWFGKRPDSTLGPDLAEVGVELKTTPFRKLKSGKYSAKERLVFNVINYEDLSKETFETSYFLYKNRLIEIGFYEYLKNISPNEWTIAEVILYEMSKNPIDYEIIKDDWETIQEYVNNGLAHELSESLTNYLSACTKGHSAKSMRTQPFSEIRAKQRAFSFKSGYMTSLLRKYVLGDEKIESIVKNRFELINKDIETLILEHFQPYFGWSIEKLKQHFGIERDSYQTNYRIAAAILNLDGKYTETAAFQNVEEFEKASIVLKTVKFNENNINKESMSFPAFNFEELSQESWVNEEGEPSAEWHVFLSETRFLFFVVKTENGQDIFKGVKFFGVPEKDLQGPIRSVWEDTVQKINEGVQLKAVKWGNGIRIENNFIAKSDNLISHVRPHETLADYSENGRYAEKLPAAIQWINRPSGVNYSDNWMTKQAFWLNNDYIREQVKELL